MSCSKEQCNIQRVTVNRAVFHNVKTVLFYATIEKFEPKYVIDTKESYQLVENASGIQFNSNVVHYKCEEIRLNVLGFSAP